MTKTKLVIAFGSFLFLLSCSNAEDAKKVCGCENLYQAMRNQQIAYRLDDKMSSEDAAAKAKKENKAELDKCTKLQDDLGDHTYEELRKECGNK